MSSYHYSFYSPTECTAWVFSHRFHCLLRIFSHRFHRFTQNFLLRMFSHRFHRFTQKLGCLQGGALVSSAPTKQEVHQPSKIDILPRNPQNPQNCLLSVFSHRLHRLTQNFLLSVSSHRFHSTELLAECVLPQISQIYTDCLGAFKGVHLSQVHPLKLAGSVNSACSVGEHPQQKVL